MKRIAWLTALILGTLAGLVILWQFRQAIIAFLLSLATAAAVRPVISGLTRRGLKPALAVVVTYIFLLLLVGGLFALISRTLLTDLEQITNNLTGVYESIVKTWPESENQILKTIANQLPPEQELLNALTGVEGRQAMQGLLGTASGLAGFFGQSAVIIILSIYWSADRVHFERLWLSLLPVDKRNRARDAWWAIESGVGYYIVGEVVQSYLLVVILWLVFTGIGLPQPALMAVISALAWLIPWLGAILAIIPVIAIGLTVNPGIAFAAGLLTLVILTLMELYVQPRFYTRQRLNSLFLVLVVIIMAQVSGIIGLIIAPVLVAALQIAFQHFIAVQETGLQTEKISEEFKQLQASLGNIQARLRIQDHGATPEFQNLMVRLQTLLDKTTLYLESTGFKQKQKESKTTE